MVANQNLSGAYAFWIATLMFGLPLLSSFYLILFASSAFLILIAYVLAAALIGLVILARTGKDFVHAKDVQKVERHKSNSYRIGYLALSFSTLAVSSFWLMKYFVLVAYPSPNSTLASAMGATYLVSVSAATVCAVAFLLPRIFPSLGNAISENRQFFWVAIVIGVCYFFTYLILVNQIIITGFNTPPGNYVPSPSGSYPFTFVFTSGPPPSAVLESAVYIPEVLVQLNQYFNFIFMPFEMILGILLSSLVAASVVVTFHLIKSFTTSHSCLTGVTVTGIGGFFGFTATCPTCLAPTLVSVFSGGVSATVPSLYTHLAGVFLPPIVSIIALILGLIFLDHRTKKLVTGSKSVSTISLN